VTNRGKAERVLAECKKKKEEARNLDTNIRVSASLWQLGKDGKLSQVSRLRILVAKLPTIFADYVGAVCQGIPCGDTNSNGFRCAVLGHPVWF